MRKKNPGSCAATRTRQSLVNLGRPRLLPNLFQKGKAPQERRPTSLTCSVYYAPIR